MTIKGLTPEQQILLDYIRSFTTISVIVPLYYQGAIAASEFLTYAATKLYLCLDSFYGSSNAANATIPYINLRNQADIIFFYFTCNSALFDTVAAANEYQQVTNHFRNYYFSRFEYAVYTTMRFIGYRLTIP